MYRSLFPRDMFAEIDRLQREMQQAFDLSPSLRGIGRQGFPALNVGHTPQAVEVYAFAPGVDPSSIEVQFERGLLSLSGERASSLPESESKAAVHVNERFHGRFRRVLTLPDDADPDRIDARMADGVLRVTIPRRALAQPRRIDVH